MFVRSRKFRKMCAIIRLHASEKWPGTSVGKARAATPAEKAKPAKAGDAK
jgi:hypothetical protein